MGSKHSMLFPSVFHMNTVTQPSTKSEPLIHPALNYNYSEVFSYGQDLSKHVVGDLHRIIQASTSSPASFSLKYISFQQRWVVLISNVAGKRVQDAKIKFAFKFHSSKRLSIPFSPTILVQNDETED